MLREIHNYSWLDVLQLEWSLQSQQDFLLRHCSGFLRHMMGDDKCTVNVMNGYFWIQICSLFWAQFQDQGPAEERTTSLTPVPKDSSAFSAVCKSSDCLLQFQFQSTLSLRVDVHAGSFMTTVILCMFVHMHCRWFALAFWWSNFKLNSIHKHSRAWLFFSWNYQVNLLALSGSCDGVRLRRRETGWTQYE